MLLLLCSQMCVFQAHGPTQWCGRIAVEATIRTTAPHPTNSNVTRFHRVSMVPLTVRWALCWAATTITFAPTWTPVMNSTGTKAPLTAEATAEAAISKVFRSTPSPGSARTEAVMWVLPMQVSKVRFCEHMCIDSLYFVFFSTFVLISRPCLSLPIQLSEKNDSFALFFLFLFRRRVDQRVLCVLSFCQFLSLGMHTRIFVHARTRTRLAHQIDIKMRALFQLSFRAQSWWRSVSTIQGQSGLCWEQQGPAANPIEYFKHTTRAVQRSHLELP
jgi:hypothetical protein